MIGKVSNTNNWAEFRQMHLNYEPHSLQNRMRDSAEISFSYYIRHDFIDERIYLTFKICLTTEHFFRKLSTFLR